MRINGAASDSLWQSEGTVLSQEYYGLYIKYYISVAGQTVKVIEKNDGVNIYEPGQRVLVQLSAGDIMSYGE